MGGPRSATFGRFRELVIKGFLAARKHAGTVRVVYPLPHSGVSPSSLGGVVKDRAVLARP